MKKNIVIPKGMMAADDAAAEARRKLREEFLKGGGDVVVTQDGDAKPSASIRASDGHYVHIPKGKLASIYWYENDPELYEEEVAAMHQQFPQFTMSKLSDGRLSFVGELRPTSVRKNARYLIQAVCDHNHPSNNNWGGSVRVYLIDPDLEEMEKKIGNIPHVLIDPSGHHYLCTAMREDVKTGKNLSTSVVSSIAWAVKWLAVFEMWLAGDVSTEEFREHTF